MTRQPAVPYDELLTTGEAGNRLRVGRATIVRWCEAGKLTSIRTPGGHRRVRAAEINAIKRGEPVSSAGGS